MTTIGCIIVGAVLLLGITLFARAVVKATKPSAHKCPICEATSTHEEEDEVVCEFCGSKWRVDHLYPE